MSVSPSLLSAMRGGEKARRIDQHEVIIKSSRFSLSQSAYSIINYIPGTTQNDTLDETVPNGVLSGSVAGIVGDFLSGPCNDSDIQPLGLYIDDALGYTWENKPAIASGKVAILEGVGSSVTIFVYETHLSGTPLVYAVGNKVYPAASGLLTNESGFNSNIVAMVIKVPSAASPGLGLKMLL